VDRCRLRPGGAFRARGRGDWNWAQNFKIVHYGGGLFAVLLLMADAYRQARSRETRVGGDDVAARLAA
jgi:hypothetical protein